MADVGDFLMGLPGKVKGAVTVPQGTPQPTRAPGQGVPMAPGLNPIQRLMYRIQNDPNFARAMQVAGLTLMTKPKGAFGRNFAESALTGMQALQGGRQAEAGAARQAEQDAQQKKESEQRIAGSQAQIQQGEERLKLEKERQRKAGMDAWSDYEFRKKQLSQTDRELAIREREAAAKAAGTGAFASTALSTKDRMAMTYAQDMVRQGKFTTPEEALPLAYSVVEWSEARAAHVTRVAAQLMSNPLLFPDKDMTDEEKIVKATKMAEAIVDRSMTRPDYTPSAGGQQPAPQMAPMTDGVPPLLARPQ